jgi:hypothetical protein
LLVLFLINIYSQDYNYTLKYSYGHYMVFVVSVTIFFVLQFLFCLQLFIFWLIITTLCILHWRCKIHRVVIISQNENINLLTVFSRRFFYWLRTIQIFNRDIFLNFEIQINKILIQYPTEKDFLLTCYIWWVENIHFLYEMRCFIMLKLHITNRRNSGLKLYNETYLLDKAW